MAYGRMLGANISTSEKVTDLSTVDLKLFYTWSLAHTDDLRLLPSSHRELKAKIMPYESYTFEQVQSWVDELTKCGLYVRITHQNKDYLFVPDPSGINSLRKDRQVKTIFPIEKMEDVKSTWEHNEALISKLVDSMRAADNHWLSDDNRLPAEVKRSDEKRSEGKGISISPTNGNADGDMQANKDSLAPEEGNIKLGDVNSLVSMFKPVNPSYKRLYANKTQRAALNRMLKEHGYEKIENSISSLPLVVGKQFAPTITTPLELESKMGSLIAYLQRNQVAVEKFAVTKL